MRFCVCVCSFICCFRLKLCCIKLFSPLVLPEQEVSGAGLSKNDLLVSLLLEILANSDQKEHRLYSLEQELCVRLRETTKRQVPNFTEFAGWPFRAFLERNPAHFRLWMKDYHFLVSMKKAKKKKKKHKRIDSDQTSVTSTDTASDPLGNEEQQKSTELHCLQTFDTEAAGVDTEPWTAVKSKAARPKSSTQKSKQTIQTTAGPATLDQSAENLGQTSEEEHAAKIDMAMDESLIGDLLSQHPGSTLIFKRSGENYTQDRLQFTLDIVSLWNTPNRDKAYIILGVKPKQTLPHALIGLRTDTSKTFYKDLFQWQLFTQLPPQFSYREAMYSNKRVGIIQIEPNYGCGAPSIVTSDDMAPRIKRNQLWARKAGENTAIENLDLFIGQIHAWFQGKGKDPSVKVLKTASTPTQSKPKVDQPKPSLSVTEQSFEREESGSVADPAQRTRSSDAQALRLMKALNYFKKGHFALICGSLNMKCRTIDALASAPWIAVYDFDFSGRDSGLLAILEDSIKRRRHLSVNTWCDPYTGLTELGTQWWSLRGRREVPQSKTSDMSHQEWFAKVREKVEKLCIELARYSEDYTVLTFLVLWPSSELEARCMLKFLTKVQEHLQPRLILCCTDPETDLSQSKVVEMIQYEYEGKAQIFHTHLEEVCLEIQQWTQDSVTPSEFQYQLPAEDKTQITLEDKDAAWLAEDLEVLYLKSPYKKQDLTADDLKSEAENFFRGGTIRWHVWYDVGAGCFDVERSISKRMTTYIRENLIAQFKLNGMVSFFHAPGSGGSTMAQRVLWDLHEDVPCAKVRQRSGSSPEDVADKLIFLYHRSRIPVVALFDGEDEPRLKQISLFLQRSPVVVLYLKRYLYRLDESDVRVTPTGSHFLLSGFVTKQESRNLVLRFSDRCETDQEKIRKLEKLDKDVREEKEKHQMFEFGMTVYAHEFQGVRAYVRGYLGLHPIPSKELEPWQKCLGYISLIYYYGQTSIPCQFFANIMGKPNNYIMALEDFPDQFQILVVQDSNEGRRGYLRITHYIIAREILEQILNRRPSPSKETSKPSSASTKEARGNELSKEAKYCLKSFCVNFIQEVAKKKTKSAVTSHAVTYILTKTFIFRDNEEVGDLAAQDTQTRKKPQFSQIMSDLDSNPPFDGRLEILQNLCRTFPDDPNFRAHLGRFFSLCRPQEEEEAESHFNAALRLCYSRSGASKDPEELDERSNQTLMHIYHMFGNAFQRRIAKYTGWNPGDDPTVRTSRADMEERLEEVISNADTACKYFLQARLHTPQGQEDCYTYMNEIHVRLQACDFVNRVYPQGLHAFVSLKRIDHKVGFIRDSVTIIEDLIMECYSVVLLDRGTLLEKNVRWFYSLFHSCTNALKNFVEGEDLTSLRLNISRKKLKFRGSETIVAVENPNVPEKEIASIVCLLETIFRYPNAGQDMGKRTLDLHYKEWILAIRNPKFGKVRCYSLGR